MRKGPWLAFWVFVWLLVLVQLSSLYSQSRPGVDTAPQQPPAIPIPGKFVAALSTGTTPTTSTLSVSALNPFLYIIGGRTPPSQTITVNSGGGSVSITSTASSNGWLNVTGGTSTPTALTVSANPTGFQPGKYTGSITVTSPTASQTVPAELDVFPAETVAAVPPVLTTVAGRSWFVAAAGQQAVNLPLSAGVSSVGVDSSGNFYIPDPLNNFVLRVGTNGIAQVVAGNGIVGFSGDGGPAVDASLNGPIAVTVDANGNVYIADGGNYRIRKVTLDGNIATIAGNGVDQVSGDGGNAVFASLGYPRCLAFDSSQNLVICDSDFSVVRHITPSNIISTIAGTNGKSGYRGDQGNATLAFLSQPVAAASDSLGQIYIADSGNEVVRRVNSDGTIETFAGSVTAATGTDGGPATSVNFGSVLGVAVDSTNSVYISDGIQARIRVVKPSGIIATAAGNGTQGFAGDNGPPLNASFFHPSGLAVDASGRLLVSDKDNARVRAITLATSVATIAGNGQFRATPNNSPGLQAYLFGPQGLAVDATGNLYFADAKNAVIRRYSPAGQITTFAGSGLLDSVGPDAVAATQSALNNPMGVTIGPAGAVVIADSGNNQIHRVGSDGIIHLVAGSPQAKAGSSGDNGPALSALLNNPAGTAYDSAGNLYIADQGNNKVRMISAASGNITTLIGNGSALSSGDGFSATLASINSPSSVAVDGTGNVYVAESLGHRIRKVIPNGTISTYVGTGIAGSGINGALATGSNLGTLSNLAFDSQGNLCFSDESSNIVWRVLPDGTLSQIAGSGQAGFSGDGGPATQAAFNSPTGLVFGPDGSLYIADSGNDRIRSVLPASPTFSASPTQLSFSVTSGGSLSAPQTFALSSLLQQTAFNGLPYSITTSTSSGTGWLQVNPPNGSIPATISVTIDPTNLIAGSYTGGISINCPGANPSTATVTVSVVVTNSLPPQMSVNPASIAFSTLAGAAATTKILTVSNTGGGALNITATAQGGSWLSVTPGSGTATPSQPIPLTVAVNPGALPPQTYSGSLLISNGQTQVTVPITMTVSASQAVIVLSQVGMTFQSAALGGSPLPQTFGILNTGQGQMNWTAAANTLPAGAGWLSIDQTSGTVVTPYVDVSTITVTVNPAGLPAGDYYGQIVITVPGADNSPQTISIILNVFPAGTPPPPEVQPTGLIFIGGAGASPGSQTVLIANRTASALSFASGLTTLPIGGNWLQYLPVGATVNPGQPVNLVMQPNFAGLAAGTQRGLLSLLFSDGSIGTVSILAVVPPAATPASSGDERSHRDTSSAGCTPTSLLVQPTSLSNQFNLPLLQPASVQVRVVDSCSNPVTTGSVFLTLSNGDPAPKMVQIGNGNWSGTWLPQNGNQVTLGIYALEVQGINSLGGSAILSGTLYSKATPPVTYGVANAASGAGAYIAPGGNVSIYGQGLADQPAQPNGAPYPTSLGGTQVLMGGIALPLRYVGNGQINAQIPFGLPVNTQQQLIVQRDNALSVPQDVVVAPAQPAVYTQDQSGTGPGVIVDANTGVLVTAAAPAHAGDIVIIYCNGLGAVNPAIPTGTPAPTGGPLSQTNNPVTITIGGITATVNFAGLAPGYPDLYQVNAVVPSGVQPGPAVQVVLNVAGQTSPTVTMVVQ
jgi:uncharacterized protein (TIGR03437 family)